MAYDIIIGRDEADKKKFGDKGTILIGKTYVKMGQFTSLSNNLLLDVARSHVILVSGKRGSGKCVLEGTLIPTEGGSLIPIEELKCCDNKIFCINNKLKVISSKKIEFFER